MKSRLIPLEEAVGHRLEHDLTRIDPQKGTKGAFFKKGQTIKEEDLPILRDMGKLHLSILELEPDEIHEDDAALALAKALSGPGTLILGPDEGRCSLAAEHDGLLVFDPNRIHKINSDPLWSVGTLPFEFPVKSGETLAAMRIRPLAVHKSHVERAVESPGAGLSVLPYIPLKAGLVSTGSELLEGRIQDRFLPKFRDKLHAFGGELLGQTMPGDDPAAIERDIRQFMDRGADLVVCTGGMSVDADDRTPQAIRSVADRVLFEGTPLFPGTMLMVARAGSCFVIGAPACVVHDERTALDRVLPGIFAGRCPTEDEVRRWGVGGLCARCQPCHFPYCSFGYPC